MIHKLSSSFLLLIIAMNADVAAEDSFKPGQKLNDQQVQAFAKLALEGMSREFPNKPSHVLTGEDSIRSPREFHPAFYGCFDWHSSVHGHWMLVRLLKSYPDTTIANEIRVKLNEHLTAENLQKEADYFDEKEHKSFERMYGWAWLLRLAAELHDWDDEQGKTWCENIRPLEDKIVELTIGYLPRLSYPIRTGVHPDTAFALGQTLDYARIVGNDELEKLIIDRARHYYEKDVAYPASYEPSGEDFFSAGLNEADLMRRILDPTAFSSWLDRFLPEIANSDAKESCSLLQPVEVSDVSDGKLVHLAGLDFCRAWTLRGIASVLPDNDPRTKLILESAEAHTKIGISYVFSGHYEGEHWLATFAIYTIDGVGLKRKAD